MAQDGSSSRTQNDGRDTESFGEYRPFEDTNTNVPRVMSFGQEKGKPGEP